MPRTTKEPRPKTDDRRTQRRQDIVETAARLFAEAIADRNAVLRDKITAELEQIIDPVHVDLRPDEDLRSHIKSHRGKPVQLEMMRAVDLSAR